MEPVENTSGNSFVTPGKQEFLPPGNEILRIELSETIRIIADWRSIPALIELLEDNEYNIRWLAAEGLIRIGRRSIVPLLRSIACKKVLSLPGAETHHVLENLLTQNEKNILGRLLASLKDNPGQQGLASAEASAALQTIFSCYN